MSSKSLEYLQQEDQHQDSIDCKSKLKGCSNCVTKSKVTGEIDFFSLDVRFMIDGEDTFKTLFAGFVGLAAFICVMVLTYFIGWPQTLEPSISKIIKNTNAQPTGLSIFSHVSQPISFIIQPNPQTPFPLTMSPQFLIKAYYIVSGQPNIEIKWDTQCKNGMYCITEKANPATFLEIFGGRNNQKSGSIQIQVFWCDSMADFDCFFIDFFDLYLIFQNTYKRKQKNLIKYTEKIRLSHVTFVESVRYDFKVNRQKFISNNKIQGLLANILPETLQTYKIEPKIEVQPLLVPQYLTPNIPVQKTLVFTAYFKYSNVVVQYDQVFPDLTVPLLFIFALLDPLKWIINQILLNRYNKNCKDLYVANKLYYIEDPDKFQKYDFNSGGAVLFSCLIHRHPITLVFKKILSLFGKNLADILPKKCIHTMDMINKGSQLMSENVFFGCLQQLSTLQDCPAKKVPFDQLQDDQQKQGENEAQASYYSQDPVRRVAFQRFCKDNQCFTAKRKNRVYQILLDNKFTTALKDGLHKQFETYVRNVQRLKQKGVFLETMDDTNIPIQLVQKNRQNGDQTSNNLKFLKTPDK